MRCSNCGFENDSGTASCLNCGAELVAGSPTAEVRPPRPVVAKPRDSGKISASDLPDDDGPDASPTFVAPPPQYQPPAYQPPSEAPPTQYPASEPPSAMPIVQEPARVADTFTAGNPHDHSKNQWIFALIALFLGIAIGALATYILIPGTEFVVVDGSPQPSPSDAGPAPAGVLVIPVPRGRAGPIIPPGPDAPAMQSLRNALIGQNRYYLAKGNFTDNTDDLAPIAPEVAWEAGLAPSRQGVVATAMCGPTDPSTAVLLQAIGASGKTYAILDQPTGPGAGIYYAMGNAAFQCPNSVPPAQPWMRTLDGWGLTQATTEASPTPTGRNDRNDPIPPPYVPPTGGPTTTASPTGRPSTYPSQSSPSTLGGNE